ncbi:MAG: PEP-CTERM sorting domain-containing protein [Roseateles sp.]
MKRILVTSLLSVGLLAAQAAAAAGTVTIKWQGVDLAGIKLSTMDAAVSATTPVTSNYATTALNYTYVDTNESFIAWCIEPSQVNGRAGVSRVYDVGGFSGQQAQQLQGLFSSSYASLSTYDDKAAFQLALWELMRESSPSLNASSGSFHVVGNDATSTAVAALANSFLTQALAYNGPARYELTRLSNASLQDLVVATAVTAVPEPESYALFLAGLGAIGMMARRRLPR